MYWRGAERQTTTTELRLNEGGKNARRVIRKTKWNRFARSYQLQLLMLLPILYLVVFQYGPMYGVQIAFRDFVAIDGIWRSPWVGLKHFVRFFQAPQFRTIVGNTFALSIYNLIVGFPFPILLALAINTSVRARFKKSVQMVTYLPYFISTVVTVGMLLQFLSPRFGILNAILRTLGIEEINFIANPDMFRSIYVWSEVWQDTGWNSVVYIAALSGVDPSLHEAAVMDGASRSRRVWHIDLPGILPTVTVVLILNLGKLIDLGFEKAFLLQNDLNLSKSEIISTFVYKVGLAGSLPNYSYATAIGLFNGVISLVLLLVFNRIVKNFQGTSLW